MELSVGCPVLHRPSAALSVVKGAADSLIMHNIPQLARHEVDQRPDALASSAPLSSCWSLQKYI